jgi:molybdenum cofactor cytidylyltransferase
LIVGILLAAGESRRFGSHKLLHPLPDGTPIGSRSAAHLAGAVERAIAVVSPGQPEVAALLAKSGVEILPCSRAREGMGASLACGVRASAEASGWIVALADMPFILPSTLAAVVQALRDGAALAAPQFDGRRGHPVGFSRDYGAALAALAGDIGARAILQRDNARIVLLAVNDPGIHRDIDAPQA